MAIAVRQARPDDASAAANVLRRSIAMLCVADHRGEPTELAAWLANKTLANAQAWIAADSNCCVVACLDEVICGFAVMTIGGLITLCDVDPAVRFAGVSTALLAALEHEGRRLCLPLIRLNSTRTARQFYLRRGYVAAASDLRAAGAESVALAMEKRLQSQ